MTNLIEIGPLPETEDEMADWLREVIYEADEEDQLPHVETFSDAGLMTMNRGLVVRLPNGAEFQLTIVQSAQADDPAADDPWGAEGTE